MKILPSLIALALLAAACTPDRPQSELLDGDNLMVLEGATLIDGTGSAPQPNAVIVIEGERILRVGLVGDFRYGDGVRVEDVRGKYITPGFINTHAHMFESFPKPLLAFGITTVRNPGSGGDEGIPGASLGVSLRDRLNRGEILGPRMVTAGRLINNSSVFHPAPVNESELETGVAGNYVEVRSANDIEAEVRRQSVAGYDSIKLYLGIEPALLRVGVADAREKGLSVIGHLHATSWTDAAAAGIDGLLHSCSEGPTWELLEPDIRNAYDWRSSWAESLLSWAATADAIAMEGPLWEALIEALISHGTEVNPTLSTMEALYWADDSDHLSVTQPAFAPESYAAKWRGHWQSQANMMIAQGFTTEDFAVLKAAFPACQKIVAEMHSRGVLLTAGTDVGGWMTPGVSFHRELELLAGAGISNLDVLQIATRNGAEALGLLDKVGTIEPGKYADLVVMAQNPVTNISNTQSIVAVVRDGVSYRPSDLLQE